MTQLAESPSQSWLTCWWQSLSSFSRTLLVLLAAPLAVVNVWAIAQIFDYFREIAVAVVVAGLLAFLLSYPVAWLSRFGLRRGIASILVLLATVFIIITIGVTVLPLVADQAQQLVSKLPEWFDSGRTQLMMLDGRFEAWGLPFNLDGIISQINDRVTTELELIAGEALNLTLGVAVFTANKLFDVILSIVLTFYLLQHGKEVWESLVSWLPQHTQSPFSKTLRSSFRNYFLGQFIVATFMGTTLTIIFLFLKVPFGLLFGITIGLAGLLPFGGTVGIAVVTLLVALRDIGIAAKVLAASAIVQQLIENGLAPRVLGSFTGLNPFWVFIAILSGARIGGLLGVIVAVPVAVVIKEALDAIRKARGIGEATNEGSNLEPAIAESSTTETSQESVKSERPIPAMVATEAEAK